MKCADPELGQVDFREQEGESLRTWYSGLFDGKFYQVRAEDFRFWKLGKCLTVWLGEAEMRNPL